MRLNCFCLFITVFFTQLAFSKEVIVIKTSGISSVEKIVDGFVSNCPSDTKVSVLDMEASNRRNDEIIEFTKGVYDSGELAALYTIGTPATMLAREFFPNTKTFFSMVKNHRKKGLTDESLQGALGDSLFIQQLKKLKIILPNIKEIGVVYDPSNSQNLILKMNELATQFDLELVSYPVSSAKAVPSSIRRAVTETEALVILSDPTVLNRQSLKYFVTVTLEQQIPTIAYNDTLTVAGFLMSVKPKEYSIGQVAARNICNGEQNLTRKEVAASLQYEFSINLKTADRLNLVIPDDILSKAEHVIK